jgi:hypothetical protein
MENPETGIFDGTLTRQVYSAARHLGTHIARPVGISYL